MNHPPTTNHRITYSGERYLWLLYGLFPAYLNIPQDRSRFSGFLIITQHGPFMSILSWDLEKCSHTSQPGTFFMISRSLACAACSRRYASRSPSAISKGTRYILDQTFSRCNSLCLCVCVTEDTHRKGHTKQKKT